ncbi:MAG: hypothetical protein HOK54_22540 [Alphaproteobacteria bacterium]|nr:hypothetical protein [Alphaproteobacteria bacterium]
MLKLLDKLGEWLLRLFRFLLFTKMVRQHMNDSSDNPAEKRAAAKRAIGAYAERDAGRQDLIANAVSLHRSRQEVLAELDNESRKKLSEMAETMLPIPNKKTPPRK